jgi:hypothetical protein
MLECTRGMLLLLRSRFQWQPLHVLLEAMDVDSPKANPMSASTNFEFRPKTTQYNRGEPRFLHLLQFFRCIYLRESEGSTGCQLSMNKYQRDFLETFYNSNPPTELLFDTCRPFAVVRQKGREMK